MRIALLAALLAGFVPAAHADGGAFARFTLVDKDTKRLIEWEGASYAPKDFARKARAANVGTLVLLNFSRTAERCVGALAGTLGIASIYVSPHTGTPKTIPASAEEVDAACSAPADAPHPALPAGHYYAYGMERRVGVEGGALDTPDALVAHLKAQKAKALVLRNPTLAQVVCLGAVAKAARVKLFEVGGDGKLVAVKADGDVRRACGP